MNLSFHFISANTILANFTLSNGTVVPVNNHVADNQATYDVQHLISVQLNLPHLPPGIGIKEADFTITAYVQEVADPIVLRVSEPIQPCST